MIAYVVKNKRKKNDLENVNILSEEKATDTYVQENPVFDELNN